MLFFNKIETITPPGYLINDITRLNLSSNNLSTSSIDAFFTQLPSAAGHSNEFKAIDVSWNPGADYCDATIATSKGWEVCK